QMPFEAAPRAGAQPLCGGWGNLWRAGRVVMDNQKFGRPAPITKIPNRRMNDALDMVTVLAGTALRAHCVRQPCLCVRAGRAADGEGRRNASPLGEDLLLVDGGRGVDRADPVDRPADCVSGVGGRVQL